MKTLQLNHVALHVKDVERSCRFYRDIMQFQQLPRPAFAFPGAWFRLGAEQELHLIGNRLDPVHGHHRGNHYALVVDDLGAWTTYLEERSVPYIRRLRPDGAQQMFLEDPDGHVIELCTLPPSASSADREMIA